MKSAIRFTLAIGYKWTDSLSKVTHVDYTPFSLQILYSFIVTCTLKSSLRRSRPLSLSEVHFWVSPSLPSPLRPTFHYFYLLIFFSSSPYFHYPQVSFPPSIKQFKCSSILNNYFLGVASPSNHPFSCSHPFNQKTLSASSIVSSSFSVVCPPLDQSPAIMDPQCHVYSSEVQNALKLKVFFFKLIW